MTHSNRSLRVDLIGLLVFLAVCVLLMVRFLGYAGFKPTGQSGYRFQAVVPDTIALSTDADVRIAGIRVGNVTGIKIQGDHADVSMILNRGQGPVYANATVLIGLKSAVGEAYVDLAPGAPPAAPLRDGGVLAISQSPESTQLDQILDIFDGKHRRDLASMLDALSPATAGEAQNLNETLGAGAETTLGAGRLVGTLDPRRAAIAALIDDVGQVTAALGQRSQDIRELVTGAHATAAAVASRDAALTATMRLLPSLLRQTDSTASELTSFSHLSTPVLRNLTLAAGSLVPAITELRPAASDTKQLLNALGALDVRAIPTAQALHRFGPAATKLMTPIEQVLEPSNPLFAYLVPYLGDLGGLLGNLRAASKYHDNIGQYATANVVYGLHTAESLLPAAEVKAVQQLTETGVLQPVTGTQGYNAYPKPGTAANPQPFTGTVTQLIPDPPYGTSMKTSSHR